MKRYISLITTLLCIFSVDCIAQEVRFLEEDTVSVPEVFLTQTDAIQIDSLAKELKIPVPMKFKPNPTKACLYSTVFPGLGQIYNRKYWKLPLVYGSFIGCFYAISWNGSQYNGYKRAYLDFIDEDPKTVSWNDYLYGAYRKDEYDNWTADMKRSFANALKSTKDFHRRNRDLSYIVTVVVYGLWIIDAYVDAQLFDFDVSPDLSMRIEPVLFDRTAVNSRSVGMQLSFSF